MKRNIIPNLGVGVNRLARAFTAMVLALTVSQVPVLASTTQIREDTSGSMSTGNSKITYKVVRAENYLAATVPIEIPIVIDSDGNITVPENLYIRNNSNAKLYVKELSFTPSIESGIAFMTQNKINTVKSEQTDEKGIYFRMQHNTGNSNSGYLEFTMPDGVESTTDKIFVRASDLGEEFPLGSNRDTNLDIINSHIKVTPKVYEDLTAKTKFGTLSFTVSYEA